MGVFVLSKIVFLISNRVIGITLLLYVALFFIRPSFVLPQSLITLCAGGFISGFFAGILGIHGAIRGATLATFDISKATYMSTIGIIGIMVDIIRLAGYLSMDFRMPLLLTISTPIYIIISFLGAFIGQTWLKKIPYQRFRLIIVIAIGLVAIRLIFMHHY